MELQAMVTTAKKFDKLGVQGKTRVTRTSTVPVRKFSENPVGSRASSHMEFRSGGDDSISDRFIGEWKMGEELGKGLCGVVKRAISRKTGKKAAIKIVHLETLLKSFLDYNVTLETLVENLEREIKIMSMLHHRNIIHLEDALSIKGTVYICMDLVEGVDLLHCIPPEGLPEEVMKDYFFQLGSAISYCRSQNVIHGDLKPENILIRRQDNRVKLIDFGFSHIVRQGEPVKVLGGTVVYSPPSDTAMTFGWDDWSCGVILYAMAFSSLPFSAVDIMSSSVLSLNIPEDVSDGLVDIFCDLLNADQFQRKSVGEVLQTSDWLADHKKKYESELRTLKQTDSSHVPTPRSNQKPRRRTVHRRPSGLPLTSEDSNPQGRFQKSRKRKKKRKHLSEERKSIEGSPRYEQGEKKKRKSTRGADIAVPTPTKERRKGDEKEKVDEKEKGIEKEKKLSEKEKVDDKVSRKKSAQEEFGQVSLKKLDQPEFAEEDSWNDGNEATRCESETIFSRPPPLSAGGGSRHSKRGKKQTLEVGSSDRTKRAVSPSPFRKFFGVSKKKSMGGSDEEHDGESYEAGSGSGSGSTTRPPVTHSTSSTTLSEVRNSRTNLSSPRAFEREEPKHQKTMTLGIFDDVFKPTKKFVSMLARQTSSEMTKAHSVEDSISSMGPITGANTPVFLTEATGFDFVNDPDGLRIEEAGTTPRSMGQPQGIPGFSATERVSSVIGDFETDSDALVHEPSVRSRKFSAVGPGSKVGTGVPQGVPGLSASGVPQGVGFAAIGVPQVLPGLSGSGVPQGVPGLSGSGVPQGVPGLSGSGVPQGVPGLSGSGVPQGVPGLSGSGVPQGVPGLSGSLSRSCRPQGVPGLRGSVGILGGSFSRRLGEYFLENEKEYLESLYELLRFRAKCIISGIVTYEDAYGVFPNSIWDIIHLHTELTAVLNNPTLSEEDQFERFIFSLESDRVTNQYCNYSKNYSKSVTLLQVLLSKTPDLLLAIPNQEKVLRLLTLPIHRLGQYLTHIIIFSAELRIAGVRSIKNIQHCMKSLRQAEDRCLRFLLK